MIDSRVRRHMRSTTEASSQIEGAWGVVPKRVKCVLETWHTLERIDQTTTHKGLCFDTFSFECSKCDSEIQNIAYRIVRAIAINHAISPTKRLLVKVSLQPTNDR